MLSWHTHLRMGEPMVCLAGTPMGGPNGYKYDKYKDRSYDKATNSSPENSRLDMATTLAAMPRARSSLR